MNPFSDPLAAFREPEAALCEGFICPECMKKFTIMTELIQHVTKHFEGGSRPETEPEKSSFIGKFLKKHVRNKSNTSTVYPELLDPFDEEIEEESSFDDGSTTSSEGSIQEQPIGPRRSHYEEFRKFRDSRIANTELMTNKLLIRLDRILSDYPLDQMGDFFKRKQHEQQVVEWAPANLVDHCPVCAGKFGLLGPAGGKHHCRLCGGVMCWQCSVFYSLEHASKLIAKPLKVVEATEKKPRLSLSSMSKTLSRLSFELNPEVDGAHWDQLRVCLHCDRIVNIRYRKLNTQDDSCHSVGGAYSQICELKREISNSVEAYLKMEGSLNRGEPDYRLTDGVALEREITGLIGRISSAVDCLFKLDPNLWIQSARIEDIADIDAHKQALARVGSIQANIRRATLCWIQAQVSLPKLPTEEVYEQLVLRYEARIQRRIQMEKSILQLEHKSTSTRKPKSPELSLVSISHENGFSCSPSLGAINPFEDDPIATQIQLLEGFILKARAEKRFDELASLQTNLSELHIEQFFVGQEQIPRPHLRLAIEYPDQLDPFACEPEMPRMPDQGFEDELPTCSSTLNAILFDKKEKEEEKKDHKNPFLDEESLPKEEYSCNNPFVDDRTTNPFTESTELKVKSENSSSSLPTQRSGSSLDESPESVHEGRNVKMPGVFRRLRIFGRKSLTKGEEAQGKDETLERQSSKVSASSSGSSLTSVDEEEYLANRSLLHRTQKSNSRVSGASDAEFDHFAEARAVSSTKSKPLIDFDDKNPFA